MRNHAILCALLTLLACDTLHGPVVANSLSEPVRIEIEFSDGKTSGGPIPPGGVVHIGNPGNQPSRVRLLAHGEVVAELSGEALSSMRERSQQPDIVGWTLSEEGLEPISEDQLHRSRRTN